MHVLTVCYGHPHDPAAFDAYYTSTHAPLAEKIPGMASFTYRHCASLDGSQPPYYLIAELSFPSQEAMDAAHGLTRGPGRGRRRAELRHRRRHHVHRLRLKPRLAIPDLSAVLGAMTPELQTKGGVRASEAAHASTGLLPPRTRSRCRSRALPFKRERSCSWKTSGTSGNCPAASWSWARSPADCVVREIREEAGWQVTAGPLLDCWQYHIREGDDVVIVTYGCQVLSTDPPLVSNEHKQAGLFTLGEVADLVMPDGYKRSIAAWFARLDCRGGYILDARR